MQRPLVVSVTSYPKRFPSLHLSLQCLLTQTIKPDHVVLWVAESDRDLLPPSVARLQKHGLTILFCEDLKSFKKIIPALKAFQDAHIVTADDDVYYWRDWLKELVVGAARHPKQVVAHRVHRIIFDDDVVAPYSLWEKNVRALVPSPEHFATGVGGVFYPWGCFHSDVLDEQVFKRLCPHADDVWLYWMVRRNGVQEVHSGTSRQPINWARSQKASLWKVNEQGNDIQVRAMINQYGWPEDST